MMEAMEAGIPIGLYALFKKGLEWVIKVFCPLNYCIQPWVQGLHVRWVRVQGRPQPLHFILLIVQPYKQQLIAPRVQSLQTINKNITLIRVILIIEYSYIRREHYFTSFKCYNSIKSLP